MQFINTILKRLYNIWIIIILLPIYVFTQNVMNPEFFLKSAISTSVYEKYQQSLEQQQNFNYQVPWIEGIDVRTETNDLDRKRQELLCRLNFNNPYCNKFYRQYKEYQSILIQEDQEKILNELFLQRYEILLASWYDISKMKLLEHLQLVYEDAIQIEAQLSQASHTSRARDILNALEDAEQNKLELIQQNVRLQHLQSMTELLSGQVQKTLDLSNFLDMNHLMKHVQSLCPLEQESLNSNHTILEAKKNLLDSEFRKSKADDHRILDFFQLRYANDPKLDLIQDFSVGLGLRIPYRGSLSVRKQEYQLDKSKIEIDQAKNNYQYQKIRIQLWAELQQAIQYYQELLKSVQEAPFSQAQSNLITGSIPEPLLLIYTEEKKSRMEIQLLDAQHQCLHRYLEWMEVNEMFTKQPYMNLLSNELNLLN